MPLLRRARIPDGGQSDKSHKQRLKGCLAPRWRVVHVIPFWPGPALPGASRCDRVLSWLHARAGRARAEVRRINVDPRPPRTHRRQPAQNATTGAHRWAHIHAGTAVGRMGGTKSSMIVRKVVASATVIAAATIGGQAAASAATTSTAHTVARHAEAHKVRTYTVQPGDTLSGIAAR